MAQELRQYAARRLSPQKVPVDFMALDALPRNQMGKVERRLLRMREQARAAACKVEHAVFVS
jgi:acyl-CoA synthetase (AMP-forming)/AMP-acid ligase II